MQSSELTRISYWEDALSTYLDRVREDKFAWGKHDCALFAAGAIKAQTGHDYAADLIESYGTKTEAAKKVRELGHKTYRQCVIERLGDPIHPAQARRGDIVMRGKSALGVCVGRFSYFVGQDQSGEGLITWPTLDCASAWRVG